MKTKIASLSTPREIRSFLDSRTPTGEGWGNKINSGQKGILASRMDMALGEKRGTFLKEVYGVQSSSELTVGQYKALMVWLAADQTDGDQTITVENSIKPDALQVCRAYVKSKEKESAW